ncbi:hypothetical protein RM545_15535 [Zunongwangia sp. F260]|uniref:Uncharacterized protein n=1 Tax=Autumnicola lenta TaxID=3075593 RepID=A0ABU3CP97_9FLAO|nr:hypothetical protein [Zunongwangia sp. F260]MDT0648106.1 hypothetical protein [Zunongwangia sp. F260]
MKYPPVYIIFTQACKYLSREEEQKLIDKLSQLKELKGRPYLNILLKNFDIKVFKDAPLVPEDIWLYNYIKYEITSKTIPRKGLIAKYERKVFLKNV